MTNSSNPAASHPMTSVLRQFTSSNGWKLSMRSCFGSTTRSSRWTSSMGAEFHCKLSPRGCSSRIRKGKLNTPSFKRLWRKRRENSREGSNTYGRSWIKSNKSELIRLKWRQHDRNHFTMLNSVVFLFFISRRIRINSAGFFSICSRRGDPVIARTKIFIYF